MPISKTKMKNAAIAAKSAALPRIPKELLDQFVSGPMTGEAVNAASMAFKKALIERALGAELGHHLGYPSGTPKPNAATTQRNGTSGKTVLTEDRPLRIDVPILAGPLMDQLAGYSVPGKSIGHGRHTSTMTIATRVPRSAATEVPATRGALKSGSAFGRRQQRVKLDMALLREMRRMKESKAQRLLATTPAVMCGAARAELAGAEQ